MPEVGKGEVRLAGHDALDLGITDALDVSQGQPDAISPSIRQVTAITVTVAAAAFSSPRGDSFHPVVLT
jgi:hypothetical protein